MTFPKHNAIKHYIGTCTKKIRNFGLKKIRNKEKKLTKYMVLAFFEP